MDVDLQQTYTHIGTSRARLIRSNLDGIFVRVLRNKLTASGVDTLDTIRYAQRCHSFREIKDVIAILQKRIGEKKDKDTLMWYSLTHIHMRLMLLLVQSSG
eukprot:gene6384-2563_t